MRLGRYTYGRPARRQRTVNPQAANNYLRTKVLTATPEQLQMLLFDGAIRFGEQARTALEQKNYEQSYGLHRLEHRRVIVPLLELLPHLIANCLIQGLLAKTLRRFLRDQSRRARSFRNILFKSFDRLAKQRDRSPAHFIEFSLNFMR